VNLVDSSGWIEYLADAPGADFFAPALENTEELVVPTICLLEVARHGYRNSGEDRALQALALMQQAYIVDLIPEVIHMAARVGKDHRLPLAASVVYATGLLYGATVWTQDSDFEGLEGVQYRAKAATPPSVGTPANPEPVAAPLLAAPLQKPRRHKAGELFEAVRTALGQLPETFNRNDVCAALGYNPDRGSLYRVLQELQAEGSLTMKRRGDGNVPTIYKKTGT